MAVSSDVHPSLLTSLLRALSPSPRLLAAADRVDSRIRAAIPAVPAVSDRHRLAQEALVAAEVAGTADVEAFLEELKDGRSVRQSVRASGEACGRNRRAGGWRGERADSEAQ